MALLLVLFLHNDQNLKVALTGAGTGVESLLAGSQYALFEPDKARAAFDVSASSFDSSADAIKDLDSLSKSLFIAPYARDSIQLLRIGRHASKAGQAFTRALADRPPTATPTTMNEAISQKTTYISGWQAKHQDDLNEALANLAAMQQLLGKVNLDHLPRALREQLGTWQDRIPTLTKRAQATVNLLQATPELFGSLGPRRYVVLFQNNTELRPTGGFIGSYATLEFDQQQVTNFYVQTNIWKSDTAFSAKYPIKPPYPIDQATTVWAMRDANWDIDFPGTAKQVLDFYHKMYGQPAHGVIGIDTSIILQLLNVTGPIDFPEYQTQLDSSNFLSVVQYKVEIEYFKNKANKVDNEPKQIISDFMPKFFAKLSTLKGEQAAAVNKILVEALARKSIQIYTIQPDAEQALVTLDVAGQVKTTSSDYLYLNNANMGGGKSSLNVTQEVNLKQNSAGRPLENTLEITRTHHGNGVWPDADNVNYLRIMVPRGSTLVKTDGAFELHATTEEDGKTVFAGWFNTPVASKRFATITYRLPDTIGKDNYSLLLQRQPGDNATTYHFESSLLPNQSVVLNTDTLLKKK